MRPHSKGDVGWLSSVMVTHTPGCSLRWFPKRPNGPGWPPSGLYADAWGLPVWFHGPTTVSARPCVWGGRWTVAILANSPPASNHLMRCPAWLPDAHQGSSTLHARGSKSVFQRVGWRIALNRKSCGGIAPGQGDLTQGRVEERFPRR